MNELYKKTDEILNNNFERTVKIRRNLHMHPETEFEEFETAKIIAAELDDIGIKYQANIAKTGIKAVLKGNGECDKRRCILIRADIDALSVEEKNEISYKSKNKGRMHACGHDAHTAILLSVIRALYEVRDEIPGDIVFVFQPAEEGAGGAKPMIEEGVLENPKVSSAIGLHVEPNFEVGSIAIKSGGVMASPDEFDIEVIGRGGHGSQRDKCIDPIYAACEIVCKIIDFAKSVSEDGNECVISVGEISGGNFYNIIPDGVKIKGTSRAVDLKKRKILANGVEKIVNSICKTYGAAGKVDFRFMYPPLINNEKITKIFCDTARELKMNTVELTKPFMGGDDFSYFAQKVPAAYCFLGCGNAKKDCVYPWHNSKFNIDEDCLLYGGQLLVRTALKVLFGKEETD